MENLTSKLESLIDSEVQERTRGVDTYKERLEELLYDLEIMIEDAKTLHSNMKEENLTVNSIETEGALRFALQVSHYIKECKESINESC